MRSHTKRVHSNQRCTTITDKENDNKLLASPNNMNVNPYSNRGCLEKNVDNKINMDNQVNALRTKEAKCEAANGMNIVSNED